MLELVEKLNFFNENSNPDKLCIQWFPVNRLLKTVKTLKYLNKRHRGIVIFFFTKSKFNKPEFNEKCEHYVLLLYVHCLFIVS